jgi:hypothetical protein
MALGSKTLDRSAGEVLSLCGVVVERLLAA